MGPVWLPLAAIWALILHVRHKLYDWGVLRSCRGVLPTLVVGNVQLGGTGKTPHVLDLAQRLQILLGDDAVGVLSRGYGRKSKGFGWVSDAKSWEEVGDEPWMLQRRLPKAHVAVCENRARGVARMAADRPSLRLVLLDDGMQHRTLQPDLLVGLIGMDVPAKPWQWTQMVPAGPFRDLPSRLDRCDFIVDTSGSKQGEHTTSAVRPQQPRLFNTSSTAILATPALLVTGIAQPLRVTQSALAVGVELAGCAHYPDHHPFQTSDVHRWQEWMSSHQIKALLTTEKDAVRLHDLWPVERKNALWVLPMEIEWEDEGALQAFLESCCQALPSLSQRTH